MPGELEVLAEKAAELARVAAERPESRRAARLAERLGARRFLISLVGEFKRGKSTLINALLGAEVLSAGVLPLTAVATELSYGEPGATVEYLDGRGERIEVVSVADFVTEARNPGNERGVRRVEVQGRWPLLEPGVVLVDTPGIGSVHAHNTEAARAALLDADGAVLVMSADAPISAPERELLRTLAEREAPTFFVLNKADHLRPAEVDEVRRFVEQVLRDELGRKPEVFAFSARAGLDRALGSTSAAVNVGGFDRFVAELERFVQDDLIDARLAAARRELGCLGRSLRESLALERAALDLDAETFAAAVDSFRAAAAEHRRAFDDDRTLLTRDVTRLMDRVAESLRAFTRDATLRHEEQIRAIASTAPRRSVNERLRGAIEEAVRREFDEFRAPEAAQAEQKWAELAAGFRSRTQARVHSVRSVAGELFNVALPPLELPALTEEREQFFYLFLHIGSFSEPLTGLLSRLVPASIARRRATRWSVNELAREFDKHAGRARWDLTQRLDRVRARFEAAMRAELDTAVDAIADATVRAEALRHAAAYARERHAAAASEQATLADLLIQLDRGR